MICRTCGAQVAAEARFCATCGAKVAGPASEAVGDEERKVITVLFADLAGFTAASESADPEDVAARLAHFHKLADRTVGRFGGKVEKLLGDGVFAVFGVPAAHEDDPVRGVRAALRIQDGLADLNREDTSLALDVRVAVTTGEAVVVLSGSTSSREGIVGDVVNTASRLQQVAPVGKVIVDERTHSATRRQIEYESLEPVHVKGKKDQIPIWLALSPTSRTGVDPTPEASRFVGRDQELEVLGEAYREVARARTSRLVSIVAEPGAGKSRLIHEFSKVVDDLPDFVAWRRGRCLPYGEGTTYWALAEVLKAQAGILESDSSDVALGKLAKSIEDLIDDVDRREWFKMRLSPLVGVSMRATGSATSREELFAAWAGYLNAIAEQTPLVIVVEDLHWADPPLVDFLRYLLDGSAASPILMIVTGRPEAADLYPTLTSEGARARRITLGSLGAGDVRLIVESLLAGTETSEDLERAVSERSEGNPLYAGEFIRMLQQRDLLVIDNGMVSLRGEIPVPETLQSLIASRIDGLNAREKHFLQAAAVVGRVFWADCVRSMLGPPVEHEKSVIAGLVHKEMITRVGVSSMGNTSEYTFRHALVRDVGYSQIPRDRRVRLHIAAAEWIGRVAAGRLRDFAETLSFHFTTALDLAVKAGLAEAADLEPEARKYLKLAGERSMDLDATRAVTYYRQALDLTGPSDPDHAELTALVGRAEFASGEIDQGIDNLTAAGEAFRARNDHLGEARALTRLRAAVWMKGDAARVDEINRRALQLVEGRSPSADVATVLAGAVSTMWLRGDVEGALGLAKRALDVAREHGSPEDLASVYTSMGAAKNHAGLPGGLDDMNRALEIALENGLIRSAVSIYNNLGDNTLYIAGTEQALPHLEEGIRLATERGLASAGYYIRMTRLDVLCYSGQWDALIADADQLSSEVGTETQVSVGAQAWTLPARAYRGQASKALDKADRAIAKARQVADAQWAKVLLMGAIVLEHGGRPDQSVAIVEEFARSTEGRDSFRAEMLPMATRLLIGHGEVAMADGLSSGVRWVNRYGELSISTSRALVSEASGDRAAARDLYSMAALGWNKWGSPLEEGFSWAGLARTSDDPTESDTAREAARRAFDSLGAHVALGEMDLLVGTE